MQCKDNKLPFECFIKDNQFEISSYLAFLFSKFQYESEDVAREKPAASDRYC